MNRKQAGIILTLLALIVCTGVLATRVNNQIKFFSNSFNAS